MTVQNTTRRNIYMGNGSTTRFPITFEFSKKADIFVYIADDTGISVATDNFEVDEENSRVVYPKTGSPLAEGNKITIMRTVDLVQLLNLVNQGPFWAEDIEGAFDYLTYAVQQLQDDVSRCILLDVSEGAGGVLVLPKAPNMAFMWNENATGLVLFDPKTIGMGLPKAPNMAFKWNGDATKLVLFDPTPPEVDLDGHLYNASEKWTDVGDDGDYGIVIDLANGRCQETSAEYITLPPPPASGKATVLTLICTAEYVEFETQGGSIKWAGGEAPAGTGDLMVTFYGAKGSWYGMPTDFAEA